MARRQRITLGGHLYHVLNRANGPLRIFRKAGPFLAFGQILAEAIDLGPTAAAARSQLESTLRPKGHPKECAALL